MKKCIKIIKLGDRAELMYNLRTNNNININNLVWEIDK